MSYNGQAVPEWISLDDQNSKLKGTTADIDVNSEYVFAINATADGTTYQKVITLGVATTCPVGYIEYPKTDV